MNSTDKFEKLFFIFGILFLILVWLISSVAVNNTVAIPKISETFKAMGKLFSTKETYAILGLTILKIAITVLSAFIISIILVFFSTLSSKFQAFLSPIMSFLKTLPIAVIILMLLFVFGGDKAPIFVALLVVVPIMYEAMYNGVKGIDKSLVDETKMLSKTNMFVVRKIYLPLTYPYALLSIFQSIGLGLKVMVMAELIAQTKRSIGYEMSYYKSMFDMEYVFAWGVIMVALVIVTEIIIRRLKKNVY